MAVLAYSAPLPSPNLRQDIHVHDLYGTAVSVESVVSRDGVDSLICTCISEYRIAGNFGEVFNLAI